MKKSLLIVILFYSANIALEIHASQKKRPLSRSVEHQKSKDRIQVPSRPLTPQPERDNLAANYDTASNAWQKQPHVVASIKAFVTNQVPQNQ